MKNEILLENITYKKSLEKTVKLCVRVTPRTYKYIQKERVMIALLCDEMAKLIAAKKFEYKSYSFLIGNRTHPVGGNITPKIHDILKVYASEHGTTITNMIESVLFEIKEKQREVIENGTLKTNTTRMARHSI